MVFIIVMNLVLSTFDYVLFDLLNFNFFLYILYN